MPQVKKNFNYQMTVADIHKWEKRYGRIPAGSVVMIRSDWSKRWPDPALATLTEFPGVKLAALKFLHHKRHILFHGHEPLDTDSTPTLEGEVWLMHHGYAQAEGVDNLSQVKPKGCLIEIGYPKFGGGLGGYARYIAICPPGWKHGVERRPAARVAAAQVQQRPAVGHERWGCGRGPRPTPRLTSTSRSPSGFTTCLLMPSSFGSRPKARPTSCGRCSTGMPELAADDALGAPAAAGRG